MTDAIFKPTVSDIERAISLTIQRLRDDATWCARIGCVDKDGLPCDPLSMDARRWCASAQLLRSEMDAVPRSKGHSFPIYRMVQQHLGGWAELTHINDAEDGRINSIRALEEVRDGLCASRRLNGR